MTFETFDQSDEETGPDQQTDNDKDKYKDKDIEKDKYIESTFKEQSLWLLTFETLITNLTIKNLNPWQSLLPDN